MGVQRGDTIKISVLITDEDGQNVTPTSQTVEIKDPDGTVVYSTTSPSSDPETGEYYIKHTISESGAVGNYVCTWKAEVGTDKGRTKIIFAVEA